MFIEHLEVDAVRLLGQFSRILHVVHQLDVGAPRYVLNSLSLRRVLYLLVERFLYIVMLELLSLLCFVCDVSRDVRRPLDRIARWTIISLIPLSR